jgi:hypothetical protein
MTLARQRFGQMAWGTLPATLPHHENVAALESRGSAVASNVPGFLSLPVPPCLLAWSLIVAAYSSANFRD